MDVEIAEHGHGLTWTVREAMSRSSHALVDDGRVWLIDPLDHAPALTRAASLGEIAGVVQLLDRHNRDGREIAERLGVPHLRLPAELPGTPFECVSVVDVPGWRERGLWWPAARTLVVAEAVGSGPYFALSDASPLGVHPFLRLRPPGVLRRYARAGTRAVLCGHGTAVLRDGDDALRGALHRSVLDLPRLPAGLWRSRGG